jgi:hypothetical protein
MNRSYRRRIRIRLVRPDGQAVEPGPRPIEGYVPYQTYATRFRYGLHAYCGFRLVWVGRWECQVSLVYLPHSSCVPSFPISNFIENSCAACQSRIWKTNASAKLGPIDTRERQSMEYRRKLREKWGNEKGVREIERYVFSPFSSSFNLDINPNSITNYEFVNSDMSCLIPPSALFFSFFINISTLAGNAVSRQTSRTPPHSKRPCWTPGRRKTTIGGGIRGRGFRSLWRRGRVSLSRAGGVLFCWGVVWSRGVTLFTRKWKWKWIWELTLGVLVFCCRGHGCRATLAGTWVVLFVFMSPVTVLFTVTYSLYPHITQYEYALYDILQSN